MSRAVRRSQGQEAEKIFSVSGIASLDVRESLGILVFRTERHGREQSQVTAHTYKYIFINYVYFYQKCCNCTKRRIIIPVLRCGCTDCPL